MKSIKTKAITLLTSCFAFALIFLSQTANAQNGADAFKNSTPEQRALMQTTMMKTKLKLDTIQVTKVQAINLKYAQKLDPILKGDGSKFSKFKELRSIQKDKDADLKGVLTADQFKQYQAMEEEMKAKVKEKMSGRN